MQDQTSAVLRASHLLLRITMKRNQLPLPMAHRLASNDSSTYALLIAGGTSLDLRPVDTQDLPQVGWISRSACKRLICFLIRLFASDPAWLQHGVRFHQPGQFVL